MKPSSRRTDFLVLLGVGALTAALLAWVSAAHELRFVDLVSFSRRARELSEGRAPNDGLYPLGYPALLALGHALGVSIFPWAKVVSGLAGLGLVLGVGRRYGAPAALWLLVQVPFLQWASTEGTDLLAAALSLGAILSARRPILAGALLGAACTVRWTAAAWLPALWLAVPPGRRTEAMVATLAGTLPHWLACAWAGAWVLPNQDLNLMIAAGPAGPGPGGGGWLDTLARIPPGLGRALPHALPDLPSRVGAASLVASLLLRVRDEADRENRRAAGALLIGAALHFLLLAAVFANPRLALPLTLVALLGPGVLLSALARRGRRLAGAGAVVLVTAAALVAWSTLPTQRSPTNEEASLTRLEEAFAEAGGAPAGAPIMSNSPWAHTEADGWIVPAANLGGLRVTPRTTPADLAKIADDAGLTTLALDPARGRRDLAGLRELFEARSTDVAGWTCRSASSWRIWVRVPAAEAAPIR